jgi:small subunit ribosomal protein S4
MARYIDANCKKCRREGDKLFLKGSRCLTEKCGFERRGYAPGQHGQNMRRKVSEFGRQLREKQKVRRIYGILERQFRNYFAAAEGKKGITGETLLQLLECRLDNMVYRLGFAPSRKAARQLVRHRHFLVNGRIVDIPSYNVKVRDIIRVKDASKGMDVFHQSLKEARGEELAWLRLNKANLEGELLEIPKREDIPTPAQEQLIVELYSK